MMKIRPTFTLYKQRLGKALAEGRKGWSMVDEHGVDVDKLSEDDKVSYAKDMADASSPDDQKQVAELYALPVEQPEVEESEKEPVPEHKHQWRRGMLPGTKYLRICMYPNCGISEQIDYKAWEILA